jgi:RNA polymerase sigma-70 factor (ECF subfamily)
MLTIAQAVAKQPATLGASKLPGRVASPGARSLGPNTSDGALIEAIAAGDRHAMALLFGRHNVRVYRFSLRITGNAAAAEDIVSDVFLEVWRHAGRFKGDSQVSTWLLAIARNKSLSAMRRRVDEPLDDDAAAMIEDPADDQEATIQSKDRRAIIQRCLSQLSTAHREVIELVYYHEKSIEEVAQIVKAPASTVKTRMFYARRRIEELLDAAGLGGL